MREGDSSFCPPFIAIKGTREFLSVYLRTNVRGTLISVQIKFHEGFTLNVQLDLKKHRLIYDGHMFVKPECFPFVRNCVLLFFALLLKHVLRSSVDFLLSLVIKYDNKV